MTKAEFEPLNSPLQQALVSRSFFGAKYLFLDENTRVRFGYSFGELGKKYKLQRKGICWKSVAWTYPTRRNVHAFMEINKNLNEIVGYLFWYEERHKQPKCLF